MKEICVLVGTSLTVLLTGILGYYLAIEREIDCPALYWIIGALGVGLALFLFGGGL